MLEFQASKQNEQFFCSIFDWVLKFKKRQDICVKNYGREGKMKINTRLSGRDHERVGAFEQCRVSEKKTLNKFNIYNFLIFSWL